MKKVLLGFSKAHYIGNEYYYPLCYFKLLWFANRE